MEIRLLILQLETVAGDIETNCKKVSGLIEKGLADCEQRAQGAPAEQGAKSTTAETADGGLVDLIVLPELWTTGWDTANFNKNSEELCSSQTYKFLQGLSTKYNANIIGGSSILRREGTKDRNSCLIFNRNGELKAVYDKYHLFSHRGQSEGKYLEEGTTGLIVNFDIGRVGISTCYDIRFPELFRLYAFKGADFVVNMAAWPTGFYNEYETLLHARAIENQMYYVSSCLTGKINEEYEFSGNSQVCDYRGKIIAKLEREEKALYAKIDIEKMKEYRQQMPILGDTKSKYNITEIE